MHPVHEGLSPIRVQVVFGWRQPPWQGGPQKPSLQQTGEWIGATLLGGSIAAPIPHLAGAVGCEWTVFARGGRGLPVSAEA